MLDWLREYFGEIILIFYFFVYPLLKRWSDRRKRKREEARARAEAETAEPTPAATRKRAKTKQPKPARTPAARPKPPPPEKPTEHDFLEAARRRVQRLRSEASRLLERAEVDPRLVRLVPALREDLIGRLDAVDRALGGSPTLSTIVQETRVVQGLEELLRYLRAMAQQRTRGRTSFLADADRIADACYGPLLEFTRTQGLELRTSQPVAVTGDWGLSIVPRFASTRIAPLRLPVGFERSLWLWPAIAHEVAHDFFFSLESISRDLYGRLGLPTQVPIPMSEMELDAAWLRKLFGAWLPEVFADSLGTIMLGPAYVETMRRAFRNPESPQRTAAILQEGGSIDTHPPERLRLYMATRVLHHLGRHEEADALWELWEAEHHDIAFYFLPLGGDWVGISDEALHSVADATIDVLLQRPWPELDGFHILNLPGVPYLHADHATVERLIGPLGRGETVEADPRWIVAAAVLAAAAQPTLHDSILEAARRSIRGVGEEKAAPDAPKAPRAPAGTIGAELVASSRRPEAIREAIVLGAALAPYRRPEWGRSRGRSR